VIRVTASKPEVAPAVGVWFNTYMIFRSNIFYHWAQPGPQFIRVTVPQESAPAVLTSIDISLSEQPTIVRLGTSAPAEPQIVRISSPRPAPAPTVVVPAPIAPVSIAPTPTVVAPISESLQIIHLPQELKSTLRSFVLGQPFLSHSSAIPQPPQIVRVGSAISQAPQIVRLGYIAPSESQIRVTSPSTISDGSHVQITNPACPTACDLHSATW
jgi:hypothetical protein